MGKLWSKLRGHKDAFFDEAEKQLKTINEKIAQTEKDRNVLVSRRRGLMLALLIWSMLLELLTLAWIGLAYQYDWLRAHNGFVHALPALFLPFAVFVVRWLLGTYYDFRIRRKNLNLGRLQLSKTSVVDDLENSAEFKRFMEQKKKWDAVAQLKQATATPQKPKPAPTTPHRAPAPRTPATPQGQRPVTAVLPVEPVHQPPPPEAAKGPETPSAVQPATPKPATPAPTAKAYYQPVLRAPPARPAAGPPAALPAAQPKTWLSTISDLFIGDESDARHTSVPLICLHCGAQNGEYPREGTNFKTAYHEFHCRRCSKLNQLRSAESLTAVLAFAEPTTTPMPESKPEAGAPAVEPGPTAAGAPDRPAPSDAPVAGIAGSSKQE